MTRTPAAIRASPSAVTRFLARDDLGAATRRSYGQTLTRLVRDLGAELPLAALDPAALATVLATT